jgi:hypothetical protein
MQNEVIKKRWFKREYDDRCLEGFVLKTDIARLRQLI